MFYPLYWVLSIFITNLYTTYMFTFCLSFLQLFFNMSFRKKKDIILTLLLIKKENEILKKHLNLRNKKIKTVFHERFSISIIACLSKRASNHLTIVTPQTRALFIFNHSLNTAVICQIYHIRVLDIIQISSSYLHRAQKSRPPHF